MTNTWYQVVSFPSPTGENGMDDDLLPDEKQYSIVHRDRWKPLGHPDEEVKMGETDNLDDVSLPNLTGISILAYDAEGNMYELSEPGQDDDGRDVSSRS